MGKICFSIKRFMNEYLFWWVGKVSRPDVSKEIIDMVGKLCERLVSLLAYVTWLWRRTCSSTVVSWVKQFQSFSE